MGCSFCRRSSSDMGCSFLSMIDKSELVKFCRKRKDLIKTAKEFRYALAFAHISYFQSLVDVGNALFRLVEEEVVTTAEQLLTTDSDHQSTGKDSSHLEFSSLESDIDVVSLTDYVHEGSALLEPSSEDLYIMHKSSDDMASGIYEQPQVVDQTDRWFQSNKVTQYPFQYGNGVSYGGHMSFQPNDPRFFPYKSGESFVGPKTFGGFMNFPHVNLSFYHHRHEVPYGDHTKLKFYTNEYSVSSDDPNNLRFPLNENVMITGGLMNLPYNNLRSDQHGMEADWQPNAFTSPNFETGVPYGSAMDVMPNDPYHILRQSPPLHEFSTWDYLNPFMGIDTFSSYNFDGRYETDVGGTGSNWREVRETEGIPDLESEVEDGLVEEEQQGIEFEANNRGKIDAGSSETVPLKWGLGEGPSEEVQQKNDADAIFAQGKDPETNEKDTKCNSDELGCLEEEATKSTETVEIQEIVKQDVVSSMQVNSSSFDTPGSRNLKEVVMEIRDALKNAFDYGEDVSVALETDKLQYQPRSAMSKVFYSWILSFIVPSKATSYLPTHKSNRLAFGAVEKAKAKGGNIEKDVCMNSANLSSTLEKLYMWEKKLYKEVKEEERLRVIYVKEWKRLKKLDERGAESSKIEASNDSLKRLRPKIKVVVSMVDAISRRIHKLRDEELQPQLNELIHRLMGMWKFLVECHRRQFQAIMEARTDVRIAKEGIGGNSSVKATQKLERDILNWATCFTDWLNTQKSFVKFLNGWLMKCLLQEPEETADGIAPFSPGILGAPPIFIIFNDWFHAIENVSGTGVSKAMHDFASMLHQLGEKLVEEKHLRLKVEYLSKDLEKRVKTLYEESGINWDQFISSNNTADLDDISENAVPIPGGVYVKFETMRNRLNKEKAKHEEAIKQVDDAASQGFQAGLVRIFKALDTFSLEMLKAYEQVRIRSKEE